MSLRERQLSQGVPQQVMRDCDAEQWVPSKALLKGHIEGFAVGHARHEAICDIISCSWSTAIKQAAARIKGTTTPGAIEHCVGQWDPGAAVAKNSATKHQETVPLCI